MIDPINTTDGRACDLCGETATGLDLVSGERLATCDACHHDQLTTCPGCDVTILQATGVRMYGSSELYCASCAHATPGLIQGLARERAIDERASK